MICSACGASLDQIAFPGATIRCTRCGAETIAGAAPEAPKAAVYRAPASNVEAPPPASPPTLEARCPRCGVNLPDDHDGRRTCARCSGDFVSHVAVARLLERANGRRTSEPFRRRQRFDPDVRSFPCPVCRASMERQPFGATSGIYLDACVRHGIWFDARELDDAVAYVSAVGLDVARAPIPEPAAPRARTYGAPDTTTDPAVLRAQLAASIGFAAAKEQDAARRFVSGRGPSATNLVEYVFRILR